MQGNLFDLAAALRNGYAGGIDLFRAGVGV